MGAVKRLATCMRCALCACDLPRTQHATRPLLSLSIDLPPPSANLCGSTARSDLTRSRSLSRKERNMRWTQTLIPTQKETPADAVVVSHQLMVRAGLIRQLTAG